MKKVPTVLLGALIAAFGAFLFVGARAYAADSDAAGIFKAKCGICHGADGSGNSPMGKLMKVPDLKSAAVQGRSDAELTEIITNGKNKMPPFKGKLSEEQTHSLVSYIRQLAKK